ncbi:MAG: YitT family protein [Deltaproteobacteria bacterium]|nr:YitT family protein [Deltaproteobacteria bacterium]
MPKRSWTFTLGSARQVLWNMVLIALGSVLCASAINGILIPQGFVSGGIMGFAIIIHYLLPSLAVGWLYFLLNIPIFALGYVYVGRRFFLYSIAGMVIFSAAVLFLRVGMPIHDKILSAILAGIITGVGSGIILRSLGSGGGTDILSVILLNRFSIRLGSTVLAFNGCILLCAALLFSLDAALYTLVFMYVSTNILNLVVTGLSQRKAVYIISAQWERITQEIYEKIQRGVTIMRGQGGYTGQEHQILYTVITFRELSRLKRLVNAIDPDAFVVVTDTLEVMGQRIGNQPHW